MRSILLFVGVVAVSVMGCSSAQFASATGGSGGIAGSGTGGSGGGSAGSATGGSAGSTTGGSAGAISMDAGPGDAAPPQGCNGSCPMGFFCSGCGGPGKCIPVDNAQGPVCGCDGMTYLSSALANHLGAQVQSNTPCSPKSPGTKTCSASSCPNNAVCAHMRDTKAACALGLVDTCWMLPDSCPSQPQPTGMTCDLTAPTCKSICELVKGGDKWFPTGCTPSN